MTTLLTGQRLLHLPGFGVRSSRRAVSSGVVTPILLYSNLTHYWKLDEASGNRADSVSDATLTDYNTVTANTGKVYANAGQFTSVNSEYLGIPNRPSLQSGDVTFAFAAWVYLDTEPAEAWVVSRYETTGNQREYAMSYVGGATDRFRFFGSQNGISAVIAQAVSFGAITTGTWYFVSGWYDAAHDRIGVAVNGTADITAHSGGFLASTSPFAIGAVGRAAAGNYMNGRIGPVAYWKNYAPGDDEIRFLYNAGSGYSLEDMSTAQSIPRVGIWSWFTNPRAVYYNGQTYWTGVNQNGDQKVWAYNHATSVVACTSLTIAPVEKDDHNQPSIMVRDSDKRLISFYSSHVDVTLKMRISTNVEDAGAWGAEVSLDAQLGGSGYSYPCPIQLTGETNDPIYLFWRGSTSGNWTGTWFSTSEDGGATWAAQTSLFINGTQRPYFVYAQNGTARIDFALTQSHLVGGAGIYHFYYQGGNYYQSDGTLIGDGTALPLEPADVTQVYDGSTNQAWVWDIAIDGSGYPVIVYANFVGGSADHRYRYARWNGSAWVDNEIVAAGTYLYAAEAYYSGGITVDRNDPDVVYLSKQVSSQWEIWKYTTADNGATWDAGTAITSGSSAKNCRPICPVNAHSNLAVLWWSGTYTTYASYDTVIKSYPLQVP